jgi:hypothetical protein
MVILSGCGCANSEVKAGIDKKPCIPRAMMLKAVLVILAKMDKKRDIKLCRIRSTNVIRQPGKDWSTTKTQKKKSSGNE